MSEVSEANDDAANLLLDNERTLANRLPCV